MVILVSSDILVIELVLATKKNLYGLDFYCVSSAIDVLPA